jgi:1-acyl-sn-glycerol-3-phosphate acyltransferase
MSLVCCLTSWLTSWWFLISTALGFLLVEFAWMKTKVVRKVDEARDSKYPSFRRTDVHLWKKWRMYVAAPLIVPKILFCVVTLATLLISAKIITMTAPKNKGGQPLTGWRFFVVKKVAQYTARSCTFVGCGLFHYTIERPFVEWKKYLGPQWTASYENASTIISNH